MRLLPSEASISVSSTATEYIEYPEDEEQDNTIPIIGGVILVTGVMLAAWKLNK